MGPEVARIIRSLAPSGDAERLARIARRDEIHRAAPRPAVEAGKVIPDRRLIQGLVLHPRHEDGRGVGVPPDVTHSTVSGFGQRKSEVEASGAGGER